MNARPLVIATGSNLGDRLSHLYDAARMLSLRFKLVAMSRVYESKAVDYLDQPDFLNQVLEFRDPGLPPHEILDILAEIEKDMGRTRGIPRGPRTIDLDLLFLGDQVVNMPNLQLPHPRLFERSFVVLPLRELPCFPQLQALYDFREEFPDQASPLG